VQESFAGTCPLRAEMIFMQDPYINKVYQKNRTPAETEITVYAE